jgi:hypothetical protein
MKNASQTTPTQLFERILAIIGVVICLIVTIIIWRSISAQQSMWPLPGLYFIEMVALSSMSAFLFIRGNARDKILIWGAVGAIIGFSILGALSVGFFYLPVALIFAFISITSDVRNKQHIAVHLGVCLIAAVVQAALMLAAIRLLYPSSVF